MIKHLSAVFRISSNRDLRQASHLSTASCRLTGVGSTRRWPTRPGWTAPTSCSRGRTSGRWTSAWRWPTATTATSPSTSTRCRWPTRGPTPAPSRPTTSRASPTSTSSFKVSRRAGKWIQICCVYWIHCCRVSLIYPESADLIATAVKTVSRLG